MKNTQKMLIVITTAISVGVIAGLLFAPYKGSKTRKKLMNTIKDFT